MLKKLFLHTAIYGLAPQIVKLANVLVLPIITPYLTASDFGVYGIITAVVGAVSVFSTLGLSISLSNSITKSPSQYKWLWRQLYGFLNIWSFFYAALLAVIVYIFIPGYAQSNTWWIIILNVLPVVLFGPSSTLGMLYFQIRQKPFQIAIRTVLIGVISVCTLTICVKFLRLGYMGWFIASAISQFLLQASYYIPINFRLKIRPIYRFKYKTVKKHVLLCLPTIPHYYSNYLLNSFDRVVLKILGVPLANIGQYNAANSAANLFSSAALAANQAVSPLLLQTFKTNDKVTEKRLNLTILLLFLAATSVVSLFCKELLPLLIRSGDLSQIYPIAIILIMSYNYRPMYVAANQKLFYLERTKSLLKVTAVAGLLSVILNFSLISFGGILAAAIVSFICNMYMGYSGFFMSDYKKNDRPEYHPIFWLATTTLLTVFVSFAVEWNLLYKFIVALIILSVAVSAVWKLNSRASQSGV